MRLLSIKVQDLTHYERITLAAALNLTMEAKIEAVGLFRGPSCNSKEASIAAVKMIIGCRSLKIF